LIFVAATSQPVQTLKKYPIRGVMIESNILGGNQKIPKDISLLKYGISVTDACIDIDSSYNILEVLNSYKITHDIINLQDVRTYLQLFENNIIKVLNGDDNNYMLLSDIVKSPNIIINYDNELFTITKQINNQHALLMCLLHKRLGLSELIANIKYNIGAYNFLLKNNDLYKLVTDRDVEKTILGRVNSDFNINYGKNTELFIKLMELSKRIQVRYLEEFIPNQRIGYMGTKATFSYEVIHQNFNGEHIGCLNVEDIYTKLDTNIINFGLIPTYNSLIGPIFTIPTKYKILGTIDHKIILSLFSNNSSNTILTVKTLYIQEVVYKEVIEYVNKYFINKNIIFVTTTEEGCLRCIQDNTSMTIASTNNKCNFLHLVEDNIIDHNITTFSLIKI
jgi:chorismate mutase